MGLLKGATVATLAVIIVCILGGLALTAAWFGAVMGFAFIGGLLAMGLAMLVLHAMKKLGQRIMRLFKRNPATLRPR